MSQQAGWYDDPENAENLRYWDGVQWTNHVSPKQKPNLEQAGRNLQADAAAQATGPSNASPWGQQAQQQWGQAPQDTPAAGQQWQPMPGQGYAGQGYGAPSERDQTPDGQPLAGWGARLVARILDTFLLAAVMGFLAPTIAGVPDFWQRYAEAVVNPEDILTLPEDLARGMFRITIASVVLGLLYETVTTSMLGGTLGKLALGLRVRLRETAGNLGWGPSAIRAAIWNLPQLVNTIGSLFVLLNGLWPLWDPKRQALHDKAARTNVVRRAPRS